MTTRSIEDKVESLFQAIKELVRIEAARAVHPPVDSADLPYFYIEDIDDEALERADNALKIQLSEIV